MERQNYENRRNEDMAVCEARPKACMTDTVKENLITAADLRALAGRIHAHLFGLENGESCDVVADPRCLQEELQQTQRELRETYAILSGIAGLLGM